MACNDRRWVTLNVTTKFQDITSSIKFNVFCVYFHKFEYFMMKYSVFDGNAWNIEAICVYTRDFIVIFNLNQARSYTWLYLYSLLTCVNRNAL